eukprot:ctg_91.g26
MPTDASPSTAGVKRIVAPFSSFQIDDADEHHTAVDAPVKLGNASASPPSRVPAVFRADALGVVLDGRGDRSGGRCGPLAPSPEPRRALLHIAGAGVFRGVGRDRAGESGRAVCAGRGNTRGALLLRFPNRHGERALRDVQPADRRVRERPRRACPPLPSHGAGAVRAAQGAVGAAVDWQRRQLPGASGGVRGGRGHLLQRLV